MSCASGFAAGGNHRQALGFATASGALAGVATPPTAAVPGVVLRCEPDRGHNTFHYSRLVSSAPFCSLRTISPAAGDYEFAARVRRAAFDNTHTHAGRENDRANEKAGDKTATSSAELAHSFAVNAPRFQ